MKKPDRMLMKSETVISEKEIDLHRTGGGSLRQRIKAIIDADILARLIVCVLLLVFFALLQTTVFARFRPFGAIPDLMLPLCIAVGMTEREKWGAVFGIAAAFVIESLGGATVSVLAPLYMLAGYLAGILTVEYFRDSPATRAVYTLVGCITDLRNLSTIVIIAGYKDRMDEFLAANIGLARRFPHEIEFPDYTGGEMFAIFERFCQKNGYRLDPDASRVLTDSLVEMFRTRDEHFGNARTVRNLFERAINAQADRLAAVDEISDQELELLTAEDIKAAVGGDEK